MDLQFTSHTSAQGTILRCSGRLVAGEEIRTLETAIDKAAQMSRPVVLNLNRIKRLDSTGLGALVRYTATLDRKGSALRLAAVPAAIMDLIRLTNLDKVFHLYPTEEDALLSAGTGTEQPAAAKGAQRVLVYDPSPDLCAFVRAVLGQAGFSVRSTCSLHDAKTLLQAGSVNRVLIGPGTPQMSSSEAAKTLKALVPGVSILQLDADFRVREAQEATRTLLKMFASAAPR